jgi:hypothetical protein
VAESEEKRLKNDLQERLKRTKFRRMNNQTDGNHIRLLKWCFSKEELDYLKTQKPFQKAVSECCQTLEAFEDLCVLGEKLISQSGRNLPRGRRQ